MKRQRGRGRGGKPGGGGGGHHHNHPNRTMESSGPEVKVRGPASHIYDRYLQLARDAASSGDRILSENYLQHADHYFRLLRQMQPAMPVQPQADRFNEAEFEGDEETPGEAEGGEQAAEGDQPEVEFPAGQQQGGGDREREGEFRRRGRRRNRFRPHGESEVDGGETRSESGERRPREPRENRERDDQPREGFASGPGPKPAFLGSD